MGFLQIGLGSMGKRRIRCLKALGENRIWAFDPRKDRREEAQKLYGVTTVDSIEAGLDQPVTAVVVSTPPDEHYAPCRAALERGKHVFCEANVVTDRGLELAALAAKNRVVAAPSASMRFHPLYERLRLLVLEEGVLGQPQTLTFHLGNYILDWHPWEGNGGLDFYGGRRATGAGREMVPFEFEWMEWIFGPVRAVQCTCRRQMRLNADLDDVYAIVAEFASGLVATVLIEVIARYPIRRGDLQSERGSISWDFDTNLLRHYDGSTRTWREYKAAARGFNIEEMYVAEVSAFLAACRGQSTWSHNYADDERLSRILLACEQSSQSGCRIEVSA